MDVLAIISRISRLKIIEKNPEKLYRYYSGIRISEIDEKIKEEKDNLEEFEETCNVKYEVLDSDRSKKEITNILLEELDKCEDKYVPMVITFDDSLAKVVLDNVTSEEDYINNILNKDYSDCLSVIKKIEQPDNDITYVEKTIKVAKNETLGVFYDGKILLTKIKEDAPWKALAHLPMEGYKNWSSTYELMCACKYLFEKYNYRPVLLNRGLLELYTDTIITDDEAVKEIADILYKMTSTWSTMIKVSKKDIEDLVRTRKIIDIWFYDL